MKKKIAAVLLLSTLIAGTVSASTINGDYKGNPIVKVRANGVLLDPEVPAQIIDGKTMLPLRDVAAAIGTEIKWNQESLSVDLTSNTNNSIDTINVAKLVKKYGVEFVQVTTDGEGFASLSFLININMDTISSDALKGLLLASANTTSTYTNIEFKDHTLGITTKYLRDHFDGKITIDELISHYYIDDQKRSGVFNELNKEQTNQVSPETTYDNDNCKEITEQYITDKEKLKRNSSPFSGRDSYELEQFEKNYDASFKYLGCVKPNY